MKNFDKIKKYTEIKNITKVGKKYVFNFAIVYTLNSLNEAQKVRLGILISKKFGNAVKRNKAKRRIIACMNSIKVNSAIEVVFIPRNQILDVDFAELTNSLSTLLCK